MNDLFINGYVVDSDIYDILVAVQQESGLLNQIEQRGDDIAITCPFHSDGHERHPSCYVYCGDTQKMHKGTFHCFTCSESGQLWDLVAYCLEITVEDAKQWIIDNFSSKVWYNNSVELEPIILPTKEEITHIDESILDTYESYHPYMDQRNLSKDVCEKFKIKYDPSTKSLVFPVWDTKGNLKFMTRRSVIDKSFIIDKGSDKSNIYLLNYILKEGIDTVCVVESQINALTCWQYGYPAIALFGAGTTKEQMEVLNSTPVRSWILLYDNDVAGRHGASRFISMARKDVFIKDVLMPPGKDVNDCSKEELDNLIKRW